MNKEVMLKAMIAELAQSDLDALNVALKDKKYETAFKELDGFNLTSDPITCKDEFLGLNEFFDYNYKHLNGTIFRCGDLCEIGENVDFWMRDCPSPVARLETNGRKVFHVELYEDNLSRLRPSRLYKV